MKIEIYCPSISIMELKEEHGHLFYNQDWYHNQKFAKKRCESAMYTLGTSVEKEKKDNKLPFAVVCVYAFIYYICKEQDNNILWPNNYIWCQDKDDFGDQIYVGNYLNNEYSKNRYGFEIHRHLSIKENYGYIATS